MQRSIVSRMGATAIALCMGLLAVLPACVGGETAVCDNKCDCEGCSDREFDECLDKLDDDFNKADREGCIDAYDDWIDCQLDTGYCKGGDDWDTDCKFERDRYKDCVD